jgi:low affinity Fe/Cu permease
MQLASWRIPSASFYVCEVACERDPKFPRSWRFLCKSSIDEERAMQGIRRSIGNHPETTPASSPMAQRFAAISNRIATATGNYKTFIAMTLIVVLWALSGPIFGFSTTWQLVINTGTTIVTFLMVFLIQNTQNRDALAVHLKLDEIISAISAADNALMRAEDDTEDELAGLKEKYQKLAERQQPATPTPRESS